ncbi:MAG: mycofactocin radical SAM maturase [Myxococcota bacterium]
MSYEVFRKGLAAPICLTWEVTYGCNLRCAHCLSSSDVVREGELDGAEAKRLIDEWAEMKVFYINVGGGEPLSRPDFVELMDYALDRNIGVKFSTNGTLLDDGIADWVTARGDMLDVQISVDGATPATSDPIRGRGSFVRAVRAMERLQQRGTGFKINATVTKQNFAELDDLYALATGHGAELRLTRLRPSGRGAAIWEAHRPTHAQNEALFHWLKAHPDVLTGDSFFHLSAHGGPLDGLNMCGAGRIVCCVDPLGDVYACPFVLDDAFAAGNVREAGGFERIWRESALFAHLREWQVGGDCQSCNAYSLCHGGCMAVKHHVGVSLDAPDPDCVFGNGDRAALPVLA